MRASSRAPRRRRTCSSRKPVNQLPLTLPTWSAYPGLSGTSASRRLVAQVATAGIWSSATIATIRVSTEMPTKASSRTARRTMADCIPHSGGVMGGAAMTCVTAAGCGVLAGEVGA